jgi:hypothetical protein
MQEATIAAMTLETMKEEARVPERAAPIFPAQ